MAEKKEVIDIPVNDISTTLQTSPSIVKQDRRGNITVSLKPSANTDTKLYTAFGGEDMEGINVCNTSTATTVYIYFVETGGSASTSNAQWYNVAIGANESKILSGFHLKRGMEIWVKAVSANVCFTYNAKR